MRFIKKKSRKPITVLLGTSVYIVLEHSTPGIASLIETKDAIVHGVYSTRDVANAKALRVFDKSKGECGYISILKKPIQGKNINRY